MTLPLLVSGAAAYPHIKELRGGSSACEHRRAEHAAKNRADAKRQPSQASCLGRLEQEDWRTMSGVELDEEPAAATVEADQGPGILMEIWDAVTEGVFRNLHFDTFFIIIFVTMVCAVMPCSALALFPLAQAS
eukprot:COSAG06_NODE_589_length_13988_cov_250.649435_4_plen_133_part_00